jgi:hypothetical protein
MKPEDIDAIVDDLKRQMDADGDVTISLGKAMRNIHEQNESRGMKTLRNHLGNDIVFTAVWADATDVRQLEDSELLPGELSAVTFTISCYTIRSAQRVYKILEDYSEVPADEEDLAWIKKHPNRLFSNNLGKLRITHEITAKHDSDPEGAFAGNFKYVCRAGRAINYSWSESIDFICTLKENASSSDEEASLFVLNRYIGSSFSVEDWNKLMPNGVIKEYCIHGMNPASWEAPWKDTE